VLGEMRPRGIEHQVQFHGGARAEAIDKQ
jgi:hypothetical protein